MITIKKYPNRRLYDTSKSQYVNLDAVKELVMNHKEFEVVDSKTGENLTKSILLQIITEQEANDQQSVLTQTVLKQLIRFYDSNMQTFMRQYLEQSVAMFLERQDAMQSAMSGLMGGASPLDAFNKIIENNMNLWRQFAVFDPLGAGKKNPNPTDHDEN
ncbi:MAG: polyhydroxyalkanoate synthesis repressor PhaR [Cellvibrionaceae bacterium]|nr:polyhydroxyalkanoate synthesis repressor PhaR [Cellvibrionaceae bacterium]